jgi:beta-glucosidase
VVQLYVSHQNSKAERPLEELRGFERIHSAAGETKAVTLPLEAASLWYWDTAARRWVLEPNQVEIRVGASSDDSNPSLMFSALVSVLIRLGISKQYAETILVPASAIARNPYGETFMQRTILYRFLLPLFYFSLVLFGAQVSPARPAYRNKKLPMNQRINDIISRMTLEEKIRMCFGGTQPGVAVLPGVPRLGIPPIYPTAGPRGVSRTPTATSFPTGIGLAASWDPGLVKGVNVVIGQEARAAGKTMIFGPSINIDRDPLDGRFFEYYTEDPYLNAQLAVASVEGLQSQKVAADVKHFCCNNRELNRDWYMSNVDERALREIYLPGFKAAIVTGGAWAVMTAANGINGHLAPTNKHLLTDILRNDWGFKGLVLTDFNQARNTLEAARAGLDIGMPWGPWNTTPFGKPLMEAVEKGQIPESMIDDKVRHILWVMGKVGLLDGVPPTAGGSINTPAHQAVALRAAEESLVLLKNQNHTLPLNAHKIKRIVVLGPNADRKLCKAGYGGSSQVQAPFEITPLDGLRKRLAGIADVDYVDFQEAGEFEPISSEYWQPINGVRGMEAQYFNDGNAEPVLVRIEPQVNFTWEMSSPDPTRVHTDNFHALLTGTLVPKESGYYTMRLTGEDISTLTIDKNPVIRNTKIGHVQTGTAIVYLESGKSYNIRVEYHALRGDASLRLEWALPRSKAKWEQDLAQLKPKLVGADAVIFVGGWGHGLDTEGADRQNMDFPKGQEDLINAISTMNPNTVVVLIHGSPFKVDGWIHSVPAVMDAFYPGMEGGTAIAEALFGDINPAGKLAFTWPKKLSDSPSHALGTEDNDNVNYDEGVFVGYRYYDTYHVAPQFPFGYGLSYSVFSYSALEVQQNGSDINISFTVTNTSSRTGAEVAQLYVAAPKGAVRRPVHELKGFARILLNPNETRRIHLQLHHNDFAYWDMVGNKWMVLPGKYTLEIGSSSRDILLTSQVYIGR